MLMEENLFIEVMRKHSNEELLEILKVKRKDYVTDAITAIEAVLKERKVSYEKRPDPDEVFIPKDGKLLIEKRCANSAKRLLGHIIDVTFIIIITIIILTLATIAESTSISDFEINLYYLIFYFLYFFGLETTNRGKTIGKRLLRMSVMNNKGEKPSITEIFTRSLCRLIPFDAISFLCGWNWHDTLSATYVVNDREPNELPY